EDGIRDFHVTGVQTCALPISATPWWIPTTAPMTPLPASGEALRYTPVLGGSSRRSPPTQTGWIVSSAATSSFPKTETLSATSLMEAGTLSVTTGSESMIRLVSSPSTMDQKMSLITQTSW